MPHYTIDLQGRPVLVFKADGVEEALELADHDAVAEDLRRFEYAGMPIWDGESELIVNDASAIDAATWETAFKSALQEGGAVLEDRPAFVVFLIEVSDTHSSGEQEVSFKENLH